MKRSTPPPIPRRGDEKRYSLNQLAGILAVSIVVTFIIGIIFGLKINSGARRVAEATQDSSRDVSGYHDSYSSPQTPRPRYSTPPRGEYRQEAEAAVNVWERETGEKMHESDVLYMEALMRNANKGR
jgi:hypothetical protein